MSIVPANLATSPDGHTDGPDQSGDHPVDTGTDAPTAPTLETQSAKPDRPTRKAPLSAGRTNDRG